MDLSTLVSRLPARKSALYTLEDGKVVRYPYARLFDDVAQARADLARWGVKAGTRVGLYAPNCYQWLVYDLALLDIRAISVPFTDDFAGAINRALLDRYNIALLLLSKVHAGLFPDQPAYVAFIDRDNGAVGVLDRPPSGDADEDDQLSLVFSSGSAGGLKGLVVSRKGVESTAPPIMEAATGPGDCLLLFLPMSNFQQRNMIYSALWYDFDVILTDYTRLFPAMKALNPTILLAPPVLYQMIHADFTRKQGASAGLRSMLGTALQWLPSQGLRRAIARRLFPDFYGQFGNRIQLLITGMAPIRRNIADFFSQMQLPLCESYGMMESGSLTYRGPDSKQHDSVGKLLRGVNVTLAEDGEIIVEREHTLTLRYFQCAEGENEKTFLAPGRVATGDVGEFDENGNLYLRGRKRELIVAPGGYKVHPEVIEQELNNFPDVAHSVVFLKPDSINLTCVVALNQPGNKDAQTRVKKFAASMKTIKKVAQYMEVIFADEPFSQENGMLRPNMKIDRKAIAAKYANGG